jgi:beta-lactamase class A
VRHSPHGIIRDGHHWAGKRRLMLTWRKTSAVLAVLLFLGVHFGAFGWLGWTIDSDVSALPASVQPTVIKSSPNHSAELQSLLASWAPANDKAQWGIYVQQLSGGNAFASYQPDKQFYPASLYKLLLLRSVLEKLPYSNWSRSSGKSTIYAQCIDRMIRISDNACGITMGNYAGWSAVNNRLKTLGLTNTLLNGADSQLHTTASDMGLYLKQFYGLQDYSQAKDAVMSVMSAQIYRAGIPAGSSGCTVYDKIGDLNGFKHDAAIVKCQNTTYVLTVLSKGGSYAQIADIASKVNAALVQN